MDALVAYFKQSMDTVKIVIWTHDSHVGATRATEQGEQAEVNIEERTAQWELGKVPSTFPTGV